VTVAENLEAARILHSLGISIFANYLFGIPGETRREMWMTVKMIKKIRPEHYSPAIFTPHPGSELYQYCKDHNLMLPYKGSEMYRRNAFSGKKIKHQPYLWASFCTFWSMTDGKFMKLAFSALLRRIGLKL
jgi:radical SAM superfamily enzyme YgiQ (UPF0313 family)